MIPINPASNLNNEIHGYKYSKEFNFQLANKETLQPNIQLANNDTHQPNIQLAT
jgi:hypothetical protein